jgi:hypothetical protein
MPNTATELRELTDIAEKHSVMSHPIFDHLKQVAPSGEHLGAFFDQVQHFCAATRSSRSLPQALREIGLPGVATHIDAIAESESGHGKDLAMMIAYIMNKSGEAWHPNITDSVNIELKLREQCSDVLFFHLPIYDREMGMLLQTRDAIKTFEAREKCDLYSVAYSLGVTIALEAVSHRHLIPGEIAALTGAYGVSLTEPEMKYLAEHGGEGGAEEEHEQYAIDAIVQFTASDLMNEKMRDAMHHGARDFCDRLAELWDALDVIVLGSGRYGKLSQ